jgi:hypothetical protein
MTMFLRAPDAGGEIDVALAELDALQDRVVARFTGPRTTPTITPQSLRVEAALDPSAVGVVHEAAG